MTIATSSAAAAITYLVTQAKAAFPNAAVFDGPMPTVDSEAFADRITIGWDGDPDNNLAVDFDQDFNALNRGLARDEDYRITCSVEHWDGNADTAAARTAAFGLLATFEKLMRGYSGIGTGDVTLGGAVLFARISVGSMDYSSTGGGIACRIAFQVACRARLTGS